ncbi:hypothetical protein LTR17_022271 [Elasticomyces elasticus]|nr:hypothetical protein LTR17_022271 [Elasticomyces elasticus]
MRGLLAVAILAGAAAVHKEPASQLGYQPDHLADEMVQPTAYQGAFSSSDPSEALRKRQSAVCDLSFTDPTTYRASGATRFLDSYLAGFGAADWLQGMSVFTTEGFQPTPINCGDLQSDLCTPGTNCIDFTPPEFSMIRLAASNAQAFFRNLQEVLQNTIIVDGLQIDQVVADFGPGTKATPAGGEALLGNILGVIAPGLSMGDTVTKQGAGLGNIADGMGFVGAALSLVRAVDTLTSSLAKGPPTIADVTLLANNTLADVFTGAQSKPCRSQFEACGRQSGDITKIFNSGFFMLPLADILNTDFNSSLSTGIAAGFQLIKQQTVMAILATQGYFVFVDKSRNLASEFR